MELKVGDHFFLHNEDYLDDIEFTVLDKLRGGYFCITTNPLPNKLPFNTNGTNDWKTSSLREYLNTEFLNRLGCKDKLYKHLGDYVTLLSIQEEDDYKDFVTQCDSRWFRDSLTKDSPRSGIIYPSGTFVKNVGELEQSVFPVCVFSNSIIISEKDGKKAGFYN